MKRIIKKLLLPALILLLAISITGNWFLLNRSLHLTKKVDTLNEKLEAYDEDYRLYADLYNECEFDLDGTMETLEKTTKELEALKKK